MVKKLMNKIIFWGHFDLPASYFVIRIT